MLLEHLQRDAGLVVEAPGGRIRDDLHEVHVAGLVFGQQYEVVELGLMVAGQGGVRREIDLAAKDGLDARLRLHRVKVFAPLVAGHVALPLGMAHDICRVGLFHCTAFRQVVLVVEPLVIVWFLMIDGIGGQRQLGHAAHVAVVGDGHGRHPQIHGPLHHIPHTGRTVQHGEIGVVVKVNERHKTAASR